MRAMVLALILTAGCTHANRVMLVTSTLALACDWGQTRAAAGGGWRTTVESNPIMGPSPTAATVDAYFGIAAVTNLAIWMVMPKKWRSVIPLAVTAVQVDAIANNNSHKLGLCGIHPGTTVAE